MEIDKRIESAAAQAVRQRNYRRARERALTRLAHSHPEEYQRLREEELRRDEEEGKTWTSIRGRDGGGTNAAGRTARNASKDANRLSYQGQTRNYGGEE